MGIGERNMAAEKVCYFTVIRRGAEIVAVRFGFARRQNSQIETTDSHWREISRALREQGFRLVECRSKAPGAARPGR